MPMIHSTRLSFRNFMEGSKGWGTDNGLECYARLFTFLDNHKKMNVFNLSMHGVEEMDYTFAFETIGQLIWYFSSTDQTGFCISDLDNRDIILNISAACEDSLLPILVIRDVDDPNDRYMLIGNPPSKSLSSAYYHVLGNGFVSAEDYASLTNLKISNARSKLDELFDAGYLFRFDVSCEDSNRFKRVYHAIRPSNDFY